MENKDKDNIILEQVLEFIEANNLSRDKFIETVKDVILNRTCFSNIYYSDDMITIMNNIKNIRKTYENAIAFRDNNDINYINSDMNSNIEPNSNTITKIDYIINTTDDKETCIHTMKEVQHLRDKNTALRKINRDELRSVNKSEEILEELNKCIKDIDFNIDITPHIVNTNNKQVGIIQLADLHLNEIICESNNKYDFKIASKRLKYFIDKSIKHLKDNDITDVYLINTGDNINSNRRDSEKINSATGRVRATSIAIKLITYIITDLFQHFNVNIAFVSSNESRIEQNVEMDDLSASENFDIMIYYVLLLLYEGTDINFIDCDMVEGIINIKELGKNIMITHGYQIPTSGLQKKVQEIKGKHMSRNTMISHVFFGDKHETHISSRFSRSGALCGGNGYSDNTLGFDSSPSQNVYIMDDNGHVNGMRIDLTDAHNNSDGYDISKELKKFNVKSL